MLDLLFPVRNRPFPAKRWTRIALRSAHLVGTAGVGGGYLYGAAPGLWQPYLWLTVASGVALVLLEVWSNGVWLIQLRGVAVLAKLALLGWMAHSPGHAALALILVVVISGVISHAPASVRYYSLLHGRRIDEWPRAGRRRIE